ncbi:hypothetical protein [Mucilaginibacter sp. PAMB04168]|uniref:hypothetical protein n=1 Tax=Mucilaginibacter sp. PAMB04168 TaxID=3138567 RepID=UPI0031F675C1
MNKWQQRRAQLSNDGAQRVLTAKQFLGKEGAIAYLTPQQLFSFNDHAREEDVDHFANVIELGKQFRMTGCQKPKAPDKGGNKYVWPVFNRNGNVDGGKVLNIGNLYQFINDLYDRKFTIGFTYDDLIEEAEQV